MLATPTTFTFLPFFLLCAFLERKLSCCSFLTFHAIHLFESPLPSFVLLTELCVFCCLQNKHGTNRVVCNFHSLVSFSALWLSQDMMSSVLPFLLKIYLLLKAFPSFLCSWKDWILPFCFTPLWRWKGIWQCVGLHVWFYFCSYS